MKLAIAYDDAFLDHMAMGYHPERPERLVAVRRALQEAGFWSEESVIPAREATIEELSRVHRLEYVESVLARIDGQAGNLDPDTFFSPGSKLAALRAAGGAVDVVHSVQRGDADLGLALVRPPGHHAEAHRAAGFCLFNNIAVAAAALLAHGAERIFIFDWDAHHGNGTQHQFEDRRDLMYVSIHAWPHFPGSGLSNEIGRGDGAGYTVNVPFPHGASDADYALAVDRLVVPLARAYRPDAILVSAGFDAHRKDMLGGMEMTEQGFGYLARVVKGIADELCGGKVSLFLEGGYDLSGLTGSLIEVLRVFNGFSAGRPDGPVSQRHERVLLETINNLSELQPCLR